MRIYEEKNSRYYNQPGNKSSWGAVEEMAGKFGQNSRTNMKIDSNSSMQEVRSFIREQVWNNKEYAALMDPIIDRLYERRVHYINELFLIDDDYEAGYQETVNYIAYLMGIDEPSVEVVNIKRPEGEKNYPKARYSPNEDKVIVFHTEGDNYDWSNRGVIGQIEKISHEMWHAYQYDQIRNNGERAEIYRENYEKYARPGCPNPDGGLYTNADYVMQPVELEALVFQAKFYARFLELLKSSLRNDIDESDDDPEVIEKKVNQLNNLEQIRTIKKP